MTVLVVAALAEEVQHLPSYVEVAVTGVGKVAAAAGLARRLAVGPPPSLVVNVGTAGALEAGTTGVLEPTFVTQHDFPYAAIEQIVGHATPRGFSLAPDRPPTPARSAVSAAVVVATGDAFVADAAVAQRIASGGIHLVDMEAYGYAMTCQQFAVPFRCVKVVSDSADEAAGDSWLDTIDACARSLGDWVECHVPRR